MSISDETEDLLPGAPLSRAVQLVRRLVWVYGGYAVFIGVVLGLGAWLSRTPAKVRTLPAEVFVGGMGGVAFNAVFLALTALAATGLIATARLWRRRAEAARLAGELDNAPPTLFAVLWNRGPGFLAREGQAALLFLGAVIICTLAWLMWPLAAPPVPSSAGPNLVAAIVIGLAFPSLIAERMMHALPASQMPEAPGLRRILLLTTLILAICGVAEIGRGIGFVWVSWIQRGLSIVVVAIAIELAVRGLARLFLPQPAPDAAKAATDSILATLITGGPRAPGHLLRTHLGLDFARSWALSYLAKALVPAVVVTGLLCWMLSGVKLLASDQRGVYERLGDPIAVLGPGFHIMAPWPLGRLRPVEYGTIHTLAVGVDQAIANKKDPQAEKIRVEDTLPASMNRLWETAHATEAQFLVASESGGQQGFQVVKTEIFVLYRTGMTKKAAMQAVYGSSDQAAVVEKQANRLATRYFSSHTLDGVMGAQRDSLQESLRAQLAKAVAADGAGIDIVAVLIDEVHPPAGAAAAYHAVQAAQINAEASVSNATGHATRTLGKAQEEAQFVTSSAAAVAIENVQKAGGDAYQFEADRKAYRGSPQAFLFERRARNLIGTLKGARLTIVDRRLTGDQVPLLDMRSVASAPAATSGFAAPTREMSEAFVPDLPPSTSTEGPAPPSTTEEAVAASRGG